MPGYTGLFLEEKMRIGQSVDIHPLKEGRELVLGGVKIDHSKGLDGHSDADVLVHAVAESILGALALGDLGTHFPDTDPKYKGIASIRLLEHVYVLMKEQGYRIGNVDATIMAERPKWLPIFFRCAKILPALCTARSIRSASRRPVGKNSALSDAKKESLPYAFVCWRKYNESCNSAGIARSLHGRSGNDRRDRKRIYDPGRLL